MSIASTYIVSEGVVFGADSSTTVHVSTPRGKGVVQLLTHSQKVFEVGSNSRLGVCTWGAGSIGNISHRTIVACLADKIGEDTSVQNAAELLGNTVEPLVKKASVEFVGYYLGGWNPETHEPACCKVEVTPNGSKVDALALGL